MQHAMVEQLRPLMSCCAHAPVREHEISGFTKSRGRTCEKPATFRAFGWRRRCDVSVCHGRSNAVQWRSAMSNLSGVSSQLAGADDGLSVFLRLRPRLFSIAYRMLGSAADAEDIVQDVWVRWQAADRSVVCDAAAFLATTTTRL